MQRSIVLLLFSVFSCAHFLVKKEPEVLLPKNLEQKIIVVSENPVVVEELVKAPEVIVQEKVQVISVEKIEEKPEIKSEVTPVESPVVEEALPAEKEHPQWPFGVGETAQYVVRYGPIEGGIGTVKVVGTPLVDGVPAIHYLMNGKTHSVFNWVYRADDTMQSWVRASDHLPLRQEILTNESGKWGKRVVKFNQKTKRQSYYDYEKRKDGRVREKKKNTALLNNPQDIFGAYFFLRFVDDLKSVSFVVHDRYKHWRNHLKYVKTEQLRVREGSYRARKYTFYPERLEGDVKPLGNFTVWLSDDDRKLLLQFKIKIKIGSVTGELISYTPGRPMELPLPVMKTQLQSD